MGNLSIGYSNWTALTQQCQFLWHTMTAGDDDAISTVSTLFAQLGQKYRPFFDLLLSALRVALTNIVNVFDVIYEILLFVFVYRYLTTLEHTVVFYFLSKLLRAILPTTFADHHAKKIEKDITISFRTLLQSFWHISWFHFSVTFCAFRVWDLPVPFFTGMFAVGVALFPLVSKWLSPCPVMLVYFVGSSILRSTSEIVPMMTDPKLWTFGLATFLVVSDEWLLSVERGLRGAKHHDSRGFVREQLPQFLVGTTIILGLVSYGMSGIILGPLTVIIARTMFDNWDLLSRCAASESAPSPPASGKTTAAAQRSTPTTTRSVREDNQRDENSSPQKLLWDERSDQDWEVAKCKTA